MICSINKNLISLKLVIFFYLSGVGCLFPFLAVHMRSIGLSIDYACIISIVAPFVAVLGPLIFGPLADKLTVGRGCDVNASTGNDVNNPGSKVLRFLLAICFLFSALFYGLLLTVPTIHVHQPRRPFASFMCDSNGAVVYQEMCMEIKECNHWEGEKIGLLHLSNCKYACKKLPIAYPVYSDSTSTSPNPLIGDEEYDNAATDESYPVGNEVVIDDLENFENRERRDIPDPIENPPHLCHSRGIGHPKLCQVFTGNTENIAIDTNLLPAVEHESDNETTWCKYPLGGNFQCNVPAHQVGYLITPDNNDTCIPVVECDVKDPYDSVSSVLADSTCETYNTDPNTVFWMYLVFRCFGDIFATAALCLICTACVIATRETSVGRGDIGLQISFGLIGMAVAPPLITLIHDAVDESLQVTFLVPIITAVCFFILAALVMVLDRNMPLTPPEWWWHTKSGLLALPMNTVRRYGIEIVAIVLVMLVLGIFWSALDTYLGWAVKEMNGSNIILSLTMTIGLLPAIPILWKAEQLVDYCGHNNIFIGAFTFYIIRYTGMALMNKAEWILLCEVFEVFTLSLVWITAVLYFRHLIPRKYTATGQALPVMAHFCIGRMFGALIGSIVTSGEAVNKLRYTYEAMAITACVIGVVYLLLYHLLLGPLYGTSATKPPNALIMQGLNSNGNSNGNNYTPLRVYHNERGRKGHFRY